MLLTALGQSLGQFVESRMRGVVRSVALSADADTERHES